MKAKLIICAAMFGIVLNACGGHSHPLNEDEAMKAEAGARDFAERSGGKFISCSGEDSDKDGYVTCTVKVNSGTQDILCSYKSRGCKSKPKSK